MILCSSLLSFRRFFPGHHPLLILTRRHDRCIASLQFPSFASCSLPVPALPFPALPVTPETSKFESSSRAHRFLGAPHSLVQTRKVPFATASLPPSLPLGPTVRRPLPAPVVSRLPLCPSVCPRSTWLPARLLPSLCVYVSLCGARIHDPSELSNSGHPPPAFALTPSFRSLGRKP